MDKRKKQLPELSRLEQQVMNEVWALGECTSTEVIEAYACKRPLAKTTIRTVLANLRKKGYLELVPTVERNYRLRPTVEREAVVHQLLKSLVGTLLGGSPRQLMAFLVREESIADADLVELERMIAAHKSRRDKK